MDTNIQHYRAPMVTAIGIILGFVLAAMGKWATEPGEVGKNDWIVAVGFFIGISLLMTALYRILNNRFPQALEQAEIYYHRTLQTFMLGIVCSFVGVLLAMVQGLFF